MLFQHLAHRRLGLSPCEPVHRLTVLDHHDRWQTAHAQLAGQHLLLISIHFCEQKRARILVGELLQQGHELLTGLAPVSPEIHHDGPVVGFFNEQLLGVGLVNINYMGGCIHNSALL